MMTGTGEEPTIPPGTVAQVTLFRAIMTMARLTGTRPESAGWEEHGDARHITWTWPGPVTRSFRYFEAGSRQYLVMKHGRCTGWLEGRALLEFPGIESMIISGMGLVSPNPCQSSSPPLQ